jgi:hypothetical protein
LRPIATIATCALLATAAGCGDDGDEAAPAPAETTAAVEAPEDPAADAESEEAAEEGDRGEVLEQGDVPEPAEDAAGPELSAAEREAVAAARRYVAALDDRDGARVCAMLAPGSIDGVKLPVRRGGCGPSVTASIGYRDPRGFPVWESAEVEAIASLKVDGDAATVIPTIFTRFADRDEPSVEDDPIYLTRAGGGWTVAQPSLTFYRAIGQEPPPQALAAP